MNIIFRPRTYFRKQKYTNGNFLRLFQSHFQFESKLQTENCAITFQ